MKHSEICLPFLFILNRVNLLTIIESFKHFITHILGQF